VVVSVWLLSLLLSLVWKGLSAPVRIRFFAISWLGWLDSLAGRAVGGTFVLLAALGRCMLIVAAVLAYFGAIAPVELIQVACLILLVEFAWGVIDVAFRWVTSLADTSHFLSLIKSLNFWFEIRLEIDLIRVVLQLELHILLRLVPIVMVLVIRGVLLLLLQVMFLVVEGLLEVVDLLLLGLGLASATTSTICIEVLTQIDAPFSIFVPYSLSLVQHVAVRGFAVVGLPTHVSPMNRDGSLPVTVASLAILRAHH
jgi:hypothetical protein